jgi:hypothetical protein
MAPTIPKLRISQDMLPRLSSVFQKGIRVEIETGCILESLLCDQWKLPRNYVLEKISTLFLNGKPVDDISSARVSEGAILALSSAMPGLVGAVMRRDGFFSPLREGITYREKAPENHVRRGIITVKLFNLLIRELGPRFLTKGFLVSQNDLPDDLAGHLDEVQTGREVFIIDNLN